MWYNFFSKPKTEKQKPKTIKKKPKKTTIALERELKLIRKELAEIKSLLLKKEKEDKSLENTKVLKHEGVSKISEEGDADFLVEVAKEKLYQNRMLHSKKSIHKIFQKNKNKKIN